jgi:[acyl-carrier-protein] S-malonyltransferase
VTAINVTLFSLCRHALENQQIVGACGHSVGEYSALYAAGAISLETLFSTIRFRASVMDALSKRNKGTMLAVKGIDYPTLKALIARSGLAVDICCDNSRQQQVVGGAPAVLNDFARVALEAGYQPARLGVSGAWHTHLMEEGVALMREHLMGIAVVPPRFEVVMNVTGQPEPVPSIIKENLSRHLTDTVKWADSMVHFLNRDIPVSFIEISNKAYLGQMLNDFARFAPERVTHCRQLLLK